MAAVKAQRIPPGGKRLFFAGQMNYGLDAVFQQAGGQVGTDTHIALLEDYAFGAQEGKAFQDRAFAVAEIVKQHYVVAFLRQQQRGVAADVACTAGDQDVHGVWSDGTQLWSNSR